MKLFFSRLMVKTKKDMKIVPLFEKMIKNSLYITLVNWFHIKCALYIETTEIAANINLVIIAYMYYPKLISNH